MQKKNLVALAVIVLTAIGFFIRLYHLDWQCLTVDELITQRAASQGSLFECISWSMWHEYNPPLYNTLAYAFSALIGGVAAIRIPALICGTLTIPAMFFLGREIKNETLGLMSAGFVTFLFPLVYYSQNARAYTLVMLFFILYLYIFIEIYRGQNDAMYIVGLVVFGMLCLWSHFFSVVPIAVSLLILALKNKNISSGIFVLLAAFGIAFSIYSRDVFNHLFSVDSIPHGIFWHTPMEILVMLPNELLGWAWFILIPLALYTKSTLHRDLLVIAAITCFALFPLTSVTAVLPRYALLIAPIFIVLGLKPISDFIDALDSIEKKISIAGITLFVLFLLNYLSLLSWFTFNTCPYVT